MKGKINGKMKGVLLIAVFILSTITLAIPLASAAYDMPERGYLLTHPTWATSGVDPVWATAPDGAAATRGPYSAKVTGVAGNEYAIAYVWPDTEYTLGSFVTADYPVSYDIYVDSNPVVTFIELELRFLGPTNTDPEGEGVGHLDITVRFGLPTTTVAGWYTIDDITNASQADGYGDLASGSFYEAIGNLDTLIDLLTDPVGDYKMIDWVLYRVSAQISQIPESEIIYVDNIKVGTKTYDLEPFVLDAEYYNTGDTVKITILDAGLGYNTNPGRAEEYTRQECIDKGSGSLPTNGIFVSSTADTIGINLGMAETGVNTGIFEATFTIVAADPAMDEIIVTKEDTIDVAIDFTTWDFTLSAEVDDEVPAVTAMTPGNNTYINNNETDVSAHVEDLTFKLAWITVDEIVRQSIAEKGDLIYEVTEANLLTEGLHTVEVHAEDYAGNVNITSWSFTVDTITPTCEIDMNVTSPVKAGKIEIYVDFSEEMNGTATMVPTIASNETILDIIDTVGWEGWTSVSNTTYGCNATIDVVSFNGSVLITVTGAQDLAGNEIIETNRTIYIDTKAPTAPGKLNATVANSIALEWLASTDLGSGVDLYKVYRGIETGNCNISLGSVETLTFTDTTLLDSGIYFYEVKAYDEAGNSATSNEANATFTAVSATSYNVSLAEDWNIFSVPLIPDNTSIEAVLADVMDNVVIVWGYQDGEWLRYLPDVPALSTLTTIEDGIGYWIQMTVADNLTVSGVELPGPGILPPVYNVTEGWNLIGFKSVSSMDIDVYLTTIPQLVQEAAVVYGWDATLQAYEMVYIGGVGSEDFVPGQGYWLYLTEDANIAPPAP